MISNLSSRGHNFGVPEAILVILALLHFPLHAVVNIDIYYLSNPSNTPKIWICIDAKPMFHLPLAEANNSNWSCMPIDALSNDIVTKTHLGSTCLTLSHVQMLSNTSAPDGMLWKHCIKWRNLMSKFSFCHNSI